MIHGTGFPTNYSNNQYSHGCCSCAHHTTSSSYTINEKTIYINDLPSGLSEVASLDWGADDISSVVHDYVPSAEKKAGASPYVKRVILATALFILGIILAYFGQISVFYELVLNEAILGIIIWPYASNLTNDAQQSIIGFAVSAGLLYISPGSHIALLASMVTSANAFHWMVSGGKAIQSELAAISLWQAGVWFLMSWVSPAILLLAPVTGIYAIMYGKNENVNCSFALTLVTLFSMVIAAVAFATGAGHIICLHDAVLAALILFSKDAATYTSKEENKFTIYQEGEELPYDVLLLQSRGLKVSLDRCTTEHLVNREIIKEGKGHEKLYSVDDFITRTDKAKALPRAAKIVSGEVLGTKLAGSKESSSQSELDYIIMYMVPLCFMSALYSGLFTFNAGFAAPLAIGVGIQSLLAACPCIFLVIPYMEYRVIQVIQEQFNSDAGVYQKPTVNFRNKVISAFRWPWAFDQYEWVFDRTRTTHFPSANTQESVPYEFNEGAKSFIRYLVECKKVLHFISGSGQKHAEPYFNDLQAAGVNWDNVHLDENFSKTCCKKSKGFREHIMGREETGGYYIYFGDGDNDRKIMGMPNVFGVGVDPTPDVASKTTFNIYSWEGGIKDDPSTLYNILSLVKAAQHFASFLCFQAIMISAIAVFLPLVSVLMYGVILPMWVSCSVLVLGLCALILQSELALVMFCPTIEKSQNPKKSSAFSAACDILVRCCDSYSEAMNEVFEEKCKKV